MTTQDKGIYLYMKQILFTIYVMPIKVHYRVCQVLDSTANEKSREYWLFLYHKLSWDFSKAYPKRSEYEEVYKLGIKQIRNSFLLNYPRKCQYYDYDLDQYIDVKDLK